MTGGLQVAVLGGSVEFIPRRLAAPLRLSSGTIEELTEARAAVTVSAAGVPAVGRGSVYLSDLWAWPDAALDRSARDAALRALCRTLAATLTDLCGGSPAHPLELGLRMRHRLCSMSCSIPVLARAMCASPFDAALHDAAGLALGCSAFSLYGAPTPVPAADALFPGTGAVAAIGRTLRSQPRREFPACVVVSHEDDLPAHLGQWVGQRRYRHVKLKLSGRDNAADAACTVEVYRVLCELGMANPWIIVDTNEAHPNADSVLDYLERLQAADSGAFAAVQYLEQPTSRDILRHPFQWRPVTRLKPVLLDEGLTDFASLDAAAAQGWSGLALKTCKGHSFALVAAAWARQHGLLCTLQDLTNPGYAAVHAALLAAFVPTLNGLELNSPQFTPEANAAWLPRHAALLAPRDGIHRWLGPIPRGLGSQE